MKLYVVVKSGPEYRDENNAGLGQYEFFLTKEARDQRFEQLLEELKTTKDTFNGTEKYFVNKDNHFEDYYYCYRRYTKPGENSYMYTLLKSETEVN